MQVRPLNRREEESKEKEAWRVVDGSSIVPTEHNPRQGTGNTYTYGRINATNTERCRFFLNRRFFLTDHVFDYRTTTQDVYDKCAKEIILSGLKGQNGTSCFRFYPVDKISNRITTGTIFVYGQTSSGKTHTMQGTSLDPGIVPLSISYIFDHIKKV
jgi:septin family protein